MKKVPCWAGALAAMVTMAVILTRIALLVVPEGTPTPVVVARSVIVLTGLLLTVGVISLTGYFATMRQREAERASEYQDVLQKERIDVLARQLGTVTSRQVELEFAATTAIVDALAHEYEHLARRKSTAPTDRRASEQSAM